MSLRLIKVATYTAKKLGFRGFLKRAFTYLLRRRQTLCSEPLNLDTYQSEGGVTP